MADENVLTIRLEEDEPPLLRESSAGDGEFPDVAGPPPNSVPVSAPLPANMPPPPLPIEIVPEGPQLSQEEWLAQGRESWRKKKEAEAAQAIAGSAVPPSASPQPGGPGGPAAGGGLPGPGEHPDWWVEGREKRQREEDEAAQATSPKPPPFDPSGATTAPKFDEIDKQIQRIFSRLSKGLLTAAEAEERLNRVLSGDKATDKFRDEFGPDFDPKKAFSDALDDIVKAGAKDGRKGTPENPYTDKDLSLKDGPKVSKSEGGGLDLGKMKDMWDALKGGKLPDLSKLGDLGKLFGGGGKAAGSAGGAAGEAASAVGGKAASALGGEAMAMGGRLAAAAGPAGVALAAAALAAGAVTDGLKDMQQSVHNAGDAAKSLAGNDALGMLQAGTEQYAKTVEKIPIFGKVMAEQARLITGTAAEFAAVVDSIVQRGRQIAMYDGQLARASAEADVRKLQGDIRESRRISSEVSQLIEAQSRTEVAFQDAIAPLKALIAGELAKVMTVVAMGVENMALIVNTLDRLKMTPERLMKLITDLFPEESFMDARLAFAGLKIRFPIGGALADSRKEADNLFGVLLGLADQLGQEAGIPREGQAADRRKLAEPLLGVNQFPFREFD